MQKKVVVSGYPAQGYPNDQYPGPGYPREGYPSQNVYFDYRGRGFVFTSYSPSNPIAGQVVSLFGEGLSLNSLPEWIGGNTPKFTLVNSTTMTFVTPLAGTYSVGGLPITIASSGTPSYASISPSSAPAGSTIILTGTNLSSATPPSWTGGNQPVFNYLSSNTITFVAPAAGSYAVAGLALNVTAASSANIISINPPIPLVGETVTITGTGFTAGTLIYENNISISKIFINATTITYVASASGVVNISLDPVVPTFTSLSSNSAPTRSALTLSGNNFYTGFVPAWTGGNTPVFTVLNSTTISFTAPVAGSYTVGGLPLTVNILPPSYISLSPNVSLAGTLVTLTGQDLTSATPPVWTGGNQPIFTYVNSTTITFLTPTAGSYTVGGLALSIVPPAAYSSVSPTNAPSGVIVTLTGTNFLPGMTIPWTGGNTPVFRYVNSTNITFTAPIAGNYTVGGLPLTTFTAFNVYQGNPDPVPSGLTRTDAGVYELGAKFTPTTNGTLAGISFFNSDAIGSRTVRLWNTAAGATTPIATATSTSPSQGWVFIPMSVALVAGTTYVVSTASGLGRIDLTLPNANINPDPRIGYSGSLYQVGSGNKPAIVNPNIWQGASPVITFP
jgi:Domain of unknown function (DUF4082)/IPT/TIG domain